MLILAASLAALAIRNFVALDGIQAWVFAPLSTVLFAVVMCSAVRSLLDARQNSV